MLSYMISDTFYSLIYWRDQVQGLPLHSAVVFYLSINVVERPHLLPSYILFLSGWLMLSSLMQRNNHPNPWRRGHSLLHYWNIFVHGESHDIPNAIRPMEGFKESVKYEKRWTDRMNEDNKQYARQADLDARLQQVCDETNIRTKSKSKLRGALIDKILEPKLLWYQQWLSQVCVKIRLIRNVFMWSEAEVAFFITIALFGSSFVALFIPWAFLLRWTSRVVVWVGMGPWMKIVDSILNGSNEERRRQNNKEKSSKQIVQAFMQQHKLARIQRENALKMKAFRKLLFGKYNTKVPLRGFLSRHEDIPLPESFAELLSDEFIQNSSTSPAYYIPGQNLTGGELLPRIGLDKGRQQAVAQEEKKVLLSQYNSLAEMRESGLLTYLNGDNECMQRFELVRSETEVICLHAPDLLESALERSLSTARFAEIKTPENNFTQTAIKVDLKSKLISASLSVSIRMEAHGNRSHANSDISSVTHTLDDNRNWAQAAIDCDELGVAGDDLIPIEEGVEIVPVVSDDELDESGKESKRHGYETSTVVSYMTHDVKDKSK